MCLNLCGCVELRFLRALSPLFEAVSRGQDPAGVDQNASTPEEVALVTGLVHVDDGLPRLLGDVALFAPKHSERRPIQGVV